ncbi:MAG: sulfatase-like hydrolase/transferase [Candidatus Aminicenantes bacterium]|nr:sulfatase-like hydrolase/transferase [Candidatus Aminicenantes bacterium]
MMQHKNRLPSNLTHHLLLGSLIGFLIGCFFACIESIFLLFQLGNFFVDFHFFTEGMLIYGLFGILTGLLASFLLFIGFFRNSNWQIQKQTAFFAALFLSTGFFLEIFFYFMDIIPFGGANKWSFRTLSFISIGAVISVLLFIGLNRLFNKAFHSKLFSPLFLKSPLGKAAALVIILIFFVASFMGLEETNRYLEKKTILSKRESIQENKTNILIILVDALRPDHLSCYGYSQATSPHIDVLSAEGTMFESVFATSNWSIPTHASLFTGLYPCSHGAYSLISVLRKDIPTFPEILSKNGYYSLSVYNNPLLGKSGGLSRGFDKAIGIENEHKASFTLLRVYEKFFKQDSLSDDIMELTSRWIEHCHNLKLPYFIFINLLDVHSPYQPKEPYFSNFINSVNLKRVNLPLLENFKYEIKSKQRQSELLSQLSDIDRIYLQRMYDSNIRYVDEQIGNLLEQLKVKGRVEDTFIAITADHGEYLGEHGIMGHVISTLYNEGLNIPLIFWYPQKLNPQVIKKTASQVDIFPTILSLVGLKEHIPNQIQGRDLFKEDKSYDILAEFYLDSQRKFSRAIVSNGMKLMVDADGNHELYDLRKDPNETKDLSALFPEKAEAMSEKLNAMINSYPKLKPTMDEDKRKRLETLLRSLGYIDR